MSFFAKDVWDIYSVHPQGCSLFGGWGLVNGANVRVKESEEIVWKRDFVETDPY